MSKGTRLQLWFERSAPQDKMKNHPRDEGDHPEGEQDGVEAWTPSQEETAENDRRLEVFRARCARMRANTERELARLAQRRANVRAQIGITSATMDQWKQEHQQMLRDGIPQ
ncbi:hypothetical protein PHYBOEH_006126 [Phytophthora boehmeriae]|uniref:Uncharacterized protein n=1 Tax=Phytophthora boehmeriae TaxID=109152 RepID=A0A8T1WHI5_9STRA|nr:hypothetical protein PHYBOEH_006126 [Phytophthora boehmeriae]